jgi:DNA repair exonuclease SbcCD ATPase subunit
MTDHPTPCPVCGAEDHGIGAHHQLTEALYQCGRELDRARRQMGAVEEWVGVVCRLARRDVAVGVECQQALQKRLNEAEQKLLQRSRSPDPAPGAAPAPGALSPEESDAREASP